MKKHQRRALALFAVLLGVLVGGALSAEAQTYYSNWTVIGSGGTSYSAGNGVVMRATVGQPAVGIIQRNGERINLGFWGGVVLPKGATSVEEEPVRSFETLNNSPNPVSSSTTFNFKVKNSGNVMIVVYDMIGRPVRTVVDGYYSASGDSMYSMSWDGKDAAGMDVSAGSYFYEMISATENGNNSRVRQQLVVVR